MIYPKQTTNNCPLILIFEKFCKKTLKKGLKSVECGIWNMYGAG